MDAGAGFEIDDATGGEGGTGLLAAELLGGLQQAVQVAVDEALGVAEGDELFDGEQEGLVDEGALERGAGGG